MKVMKKSAQDREIEKLKKQVEKRLYRYCPWMRGMAAS